MNFLLVIHEHFVNTAPDDMFYNITKLRTELNPILYLWRLTLF